MKIVAVMITWNNLEFFKRALAQALDFCDEVLLAEGCHTRKYPERSTDGTCEYIQMIKGHPKLKVFEFDRNKFGSLFKRIQWLTRQALIDRADLFAPGNWYTSWDDDMFFFDGDLHRLRRIMEMTEYDTLSFRERRFIYNFKFNTMGNGRWYFHRITEGCRFKPLMKLCYADGSRYDKRKERCHLEELCFFHYVYVKRPSRIKARWDITIEKQGPTSPAVTYFKEWMTIKWERNEDILNHKNTIEKIQKQEGLNVYEGSHPEVLSEHPWRNLEDVRRIK